MQQYAIDHPDEDQEHEGKAGQHATGPNVESSASFADVASGFPAVDPHGHKRADDDTL